MISPNLDEINIYYRPVTVESCEHFFTELILGRFARKLLIESQLNDLGTFAASLQFDLIGWLTKERYVEIFVFIDLFH